MTLTFADLQFTVALAQNYTSRRRTVHERTAQPFDQEIEAIDLIQPGYSLEVNDEDNPLVEETSEKETDAEEP